MGSGARLSLWTLLVLACCQLSMGQKKQATVNAKVLVLGGGISGSYYAYRRAPVVGGRNVHVVEAGDSTCGRIQDFELIGSTPAKPLRFGGCAMRVNLLTMEHMRCLANELDIPLYYSGFNTEFSINGKPLAECSSCGNVVSKPSNQFKGAYDLEYDVELVKSIAGGEDDPETAAYLFLLGDHNRNPVTGRDHSNGGLQLPRDRAYCSKFTTLHAMYQDLFGPAFATWLCTTNYGFQAECNAPGNKPCSYLEYLSRDYNSASLNGYPAGGMSEYCLRMNAKSKASNAKFYYKEAATVIDSLPNGKFRVKTTKRTFVADELIVTIPPRDLQLPSISGSVIKKLRNDKHFRCPRNVTSLTVEAQFPTAWWRPLFPAGSTKSHRFIENIEGLNRVEVPDTPYSRLHNTFRLVYTDWYGLENWRMAIRQGPEAVREEVMRSLRRSKLFASHGIDVATIPEPLEVFYKEESNAWHFFGEDCTFTPTAVKNWAPRALGDNAKFALLGDAWHIFFSGWAQGGLELADMTLQRLDPTNYPQSLINSWNICSLQGQEDAIPSPLANEYFPPYAPYTPVTVSKGTAARELKAQGVNVRTTPVGAHGRAPREPRAG